MEGITRRDFLGKAAAGTAGVVIAPVLLGIIKSVSEYGNSTLTIDWILYAGSRIIRSGRRCEHYCFFNQTGRGRKGEHSGRRYSDFLISQ